MNTCVLINSAMMMLFAVILISFFALLFLHMEITKLERQQRKEEDHDED